MDRDELVLTVLSTPDLIRDLLTRVETMTMDQIAQALDISYHRVKIMRGRREQLEQKRLAEGREQEEYIPRSDSLPPPLPLAGTPLWLRSEIISWAIQTGRMAPDGTPRRATPTGRPRRKTSTEEN
jgi:hypothetical protein